jgi:hypothetical protein
VTFNRRPGDRNNRGRIATASGVSAPLVPPAGSALWLRADLGITLNVGNVSAWADQSGNGLDVSQGTAANQPLYVASWKNSKPAMTFDGVSEVLSRATVAFTAGSALTVFVVGASANDPDSVDIGSNMKAWWGLQSVAGNDAWFITRFNGAARSVAWTGGAGPTIAGNFGIGTNPAYLCWATDGNAGPANLTFRANGVAKVTSGALADTTNTSLAMYVGGSNSNWQACTIGEIIVYSSFLSAPQIAAVESYITSFWGAF